MRSRWPFQTEPREVQLAALAKSWGKEGFAFFMRQRLGKTWTAYAEYTLLKEDNKVDWCFIICPNSLKEQWKQAIEEVDEYTPICIYDSAQKKKMAYFFNRNKETAARSSKSSTKLRDVTSVCIIHVPLRTMRSAK